MKKLKFVYTLIAFVIAASLSITVFAMCAPAPMKAVDADSTISEDYIPSETSLPTIPNVPSEPVDTSDIECEEEVIILDIVEVERVEPTTFDEAKLALKEAEDRALHATNIYEGLKNLGYSEDHPAMVLALTIIDNMQADCEYYQEIHNQFAEAEKWKQRAKEYPVATQIWLYMKDLGWSDAVCAGIMGNIMAEVGGQTLKIQHELYGGGGTFYGMCQWHKSYYPEIHGQSLEAQCDFLRDTIKKEFKMFGKLYTKGMNYDAFLQMNDPAEIALCFAKVYERCGSGSYTVRQKNAEKAYAYFVG